jgi:hypothetical protein
MKMLCIVIAASLIFTFASALGFELTEKEPVLTFTFDTSGKHTFYAISSGK